MLEIDEGLGATVLAVLDDGLERGGAIAAVAGEDRRENAELRLTEG